MRKFLILTPVLLSACGEDEGTSLERRFAMVEAQGTYGEICEASRAVTDYYLRSEDKEKYKYWHLWTGSRCFSASLNGWNSMPPRDREVEEQATQAALEAAERATAAAAASLGNDSEIIDTELVGDELPDE